MPAPFTALHGTTETKHRNINLIASEVSIPVKGVSILVKGFGNVS